MKQGVAVLRLALLRIFLVAAAVVVIPAQATQESGTVCREAPAAVHIICLVVVAERQTLAITEALQVAVPVRLVQAAVAALALSVLLVPLLPVATVETVVTQVSCLVNLPPRLSTAAAAAAVPSAPIQQDREVQVAAVMGRITMAQETPAPPIQAAAVVVEAQVVHPFPAQAAQAAAALSLFE